MKFAFHCNSTPVWVTCTKGLDLVNVSMEF